MVEAVRPVRSSEWLVTSAEALTWLVELALVRLSVAYLTSLELGSSVSQLIVVEVACRVVEIPLMIGAVVSGSGRASVVKVISLEVAVLLLASFDVIRK